MAMKNCKTKLFLIIKIIKVILIIVQNLT